MSVIGFPSTIVRSTGTFWTKTPPSFPCFA